MMETLTTCVWSQCSYADLDSNNWQTDCGNNFCLFDGGPKDNQMEYCCYCGKPLIEKPYKDEPIDWEEAMRQEEQ